MITMNNRMIAIIIVAIVVVAGIGAVFLLKDNSDRPPLQSTTKETMRLNVCGNADLNNYLDERDIEHIQATIDGKEEETLLTDANRDGVIDQRDIDKVREIMEFRAERIWYLDLNGKYACVEGPIKSVAIQYWPTLQGLIAIGAQNLIDYADSSTLNSINSGQYGKALADSGIRSFGSGFGAAYDFETMLSIGVDTIICGSANIYFIGIEDRYTETTKINMIRLPLWEGNNVASAYLTLAYLLGSKSYVDAAYEYMAYVNDVVNLINDRLPSASERKSILVTYYSAGASALDVMVECRGSGCYECSVIAGLNNLASGINSGSLLSSGEIYYDTDIEYLLSKDPDYILMLHNSGLFKTRTDQKDAYDWWTAHLTTTNAYKQGNIMVSAAGLTSGLFQTTLALMIACQIYEDEFSDIDSYAKLQELVDRFTLLNKGISPSSDDYFDVKVNGAYLYIG